MNGSFAVATTSQVEFVEITPQVQKAVEQAGLQEGIVVIYVPHTTAGVTINENADPSVRSDLIMHLDKVVPESGRYAHAEGNSPAHIKAALIGSSATVLVSGGRLSLGTWQGIFFCEFDGPRQRRVWIKTISG